MAIDIKFDLIGNPEPPTIILANRSGNILGQLKINEDSINISDGFRDASEFSFTLNKYYNDKLAPLWEKVLNFKLVYCKEWDMWFEIKVELDEETETVKTVFCTQLGQAELSQIKLYDVEINTEADIERDDYILPTVLYRENGVLGEGITEEEAEKLEKLGITLPYKDYEKASLLHRLLKDKAPHYSIAYVSPTIKRIQRSFSFDKESICDAFNKIEEEIGCLFDLPSNSGENGRLCRNIYVYDLQQYCNDCGYRGEYSNKCPKCESVDIKNGYGEDTLIFVTSDELASGGIQLVTDTDAVKNCFKIEAGDDLMTATVRNCNPNGTDYIWYFSDSLKEDMSDELVEKIESYDKTYRWYKDECVSDLDVELLESYNHIVEKYSAYNKELEKIPSVIKGYSTLMNAYYNAIDLSLFLESGLMPSVEMSGTTANEQVALLTSESLSPVAVANIDTVSLATVNSAVLAMAKTIVRPTYKIQVNASEIGDNGGTKIWNGKFTITNYSDEEDTVTGDIISVEVNDDLEKFIKQKIDKALNKEDADDLSISGLFEKEYNEFCLELKKYALNPLIRFRDACQACIDILIEQGVGSGDSWSSDEEGSESNLYENLYIPYYDKLSAIESEIKIRENEISIISGTYDLDGNLNTDGMKTNIEKQKSKIQIELDFENYLGNELWTEFCAYRRDDEYLNDNYISDGLNNAELFKKALELYEVAENEIYKSAELQHSISTTLKNLLAIPKFKSLVKYFNVGNWIRVQIDDVIYKLRLLKYEIDYSDFDNIPVEFSDVTKIKNGIVDVKSVLSQASSMATSYGSTKRQASQGAKSNSVLTNWSENGLNATQTKIIDSYDENLMFGKNAFWCRQYDPITDTYSDEQIKIVNSTIAITDDGWATTKTAIGKYYYTDPVTKELVSAYGVNGETIIGKLIIGERLGMYNESNRLSFDDSGLIAENTSYTNKVIINPNDDDSVFVIQSKTDGEEYSDVFCFADGNLKVVGDIEARSLKLGKGVKINADENIDNLATVAISGRYNDLTETPTKLSDFENDGVFITKDVNNLSNYYKNTEVYTKNEVDISLESKVNSDDLAVVATSGSYNDLVDIDDLKKWILEQIQSATSDK